MAFTAGMTDTTATNDSRVIAFNQAFIIENDQQQVLDANIVTINEQINARSLNFPRYGSLGLNTTALVEDVDPDSTAMSDAEIVITPVEYGRVITKTRLAELHSGGQVNLAAAIQVGRDAGRTQDGRAILALDASTNLIYAGAATAVANVAAADVVDTVFLEDAYNRLARESTPAIGDMYVAVMHEDVISDLREDAGANSWTDINKYTNAVPLLKNEVGMFKGFRIIRQNDCTIQTDAGAGSVDVYNSYFVGFNGLGKAVSQPVRLELSKNDKLNRFQNVGWYGVFEYSIVEAEAVVQGHSSSSRGAN